MNLKLVLSLNFILFTILSMAQTGTREAYIDRFSDIAINEAERTGVPASIKLAQGILESNAGQSTLAKKANNHFGIKCHNDWNGKKYYREDDDFEGSQKTLPLRFSVYSTT